jgi:hypothetical protein
MTNEENQNNLQKFTAEEALKRLEEEEAARQKAYDQKYANKSIGTDPAEFNFTGEVEFGKVTFKQKDGTEKTNDVWRFKIVEDREFSTSNFQLSREILTALKDGKHKISLAHRSVKGKDGNYHDAIAMIKAE